jgi:FAD/FMN-containing dehydrogenase
MSPELRAGNASLRADGGETLEAVQLAAAVAGQFLPVDANGDLTVRELLRRRDGGPLEARYGRFRDRLLAAGIGGLSLGSEAVKDVAGYDLRRLQLGSAPVDWAVFRLARLPERRERLLAGGGDSFALAEALRADPAAPAALVVLQPGLLAIADDYTEEEHMRRRGHIELCALAAGVELEEISDAHWLQLCAGLPETPVRMAARDALGALSSHTGPWAYDAGRRLALVAAIDRRAMAPSRPALPARAELVDAVLAAVRT